MQISLKGILTFIIFMSFICQSCIFSKYSRLDRFISKVIKAPAMTTDLQRKSLIGKPDTTLKPLLGVLQLKPSAELIMEFQHPKTNQKYCRSITVHLPKDKQHQGEYSLSLGPTMFGPWRSVGKSLVTKTFNIEGYPIALAKFVRLKVLPQSGEILWLDAIQLKANNPKWRPILQRVPLVKSAKRSRQFTKKATKQMKEADRLFEAKQYKQALQKYQEALLYLTKSPHLAYALATTYFALQQHFQSQYHYKRAQILQAPTPTQIEEIGENQIALGQYQKAMRHFHHCVRKAPFYPRCYYHRIQVAGLLGRNKGHLYEMYRDQYLLSKQRANIRHRKWTLRKSFLKAFGRSHTPYISRFPEKFTSTQHLRWFGFLLLLYPNDKYGVLQEGEFTLATLRKKEPRSHWQISLYRVVFAEQAGFIEKSRTYLRLLPLTTPQQKAQLYAVRGDLAKLQGNKKKALSIYKKGLMLIKLKEPRAILQYRIEQMQPKKKVKKRKEIRKKPKKSKKPKK